MNIVVVVFLVLAVRGTQTFRQVIFIRNSSGDQLDLYITTRIAIGVLVRACAARDLARLLWWRRPQREGQARSRFP